MFAVIGALPSTRAAVALNGPTIGLQERSMVYSFLMWVIALAGVVMGR